jgi:hypothetical protein
MPVSFGLNRLQLSDDRLDLVRLELQHGHVGMSPDDAFSERLPQVGVGDWKKLRQGAEGWRALMCAFPIATNGMTVHSFPPQVPRLERPSPVPLRALWQ